METSSELSELATALALTQGEIEGATKDSENPAFKNGGKVIKYADLSSVWDAFQKVGPKNGLSVVQAPGEMIENRMTMTTMLLHKSGQYIRQTLSIPLSKVDAQGYGSATTYARRYALAAFVGICPEDDDGNAASEPAPKQQKSLPQQLITPEQLQQLNELIDQVGGDKAKTCAHYKIKSLNLMNTGMYAEIMHSLNKKLKELGNEQ